MRAVIYTRTAAARSGGAERQRKLCERFAAERGWDVTEVITDDRWDDGREADRDASAG
jgi:DNA invertase Pin-like site-specific DNA recombinase